MMVSVFGCGYLGAVHAACMATLGHEVVGVDVLPQQVDALMRGDAPFHEPGFPEAPAQRSGHRSTLVHDGADRRRRCDRALHLRRHAAAQAENAADVSYVDAATASIQGIVKPGDLVIGKSTVPVGTAARLSEQIRGVEPDAYLMWNPEFLREGHAVKDTLEPDRLVYGVAPGAPHEATVDVLDAVYVAMLEAGVPRRVTDLTTAELRQDGRQLVPGDQDQLHQRDGRAVRGRGWDVTELADAIGMDQRIGRSFLNAGLGFGGGCLPKDIRAFMARAGELGADQALSFLREVDAINMRRRVRMVDLAREECGGSITGRRIAVLGAAFKPHSGGVRDSPALSVAAQMQLQGASVVVTDPQAISNAAKKWPDLQFADTAPEAMRGAELVLVLTEWPEYVAIDPAEARRWSRRLGSSTAATAWTLRRGVLPAGPTVRWGVRARDLPRVGRSEPLPPLGS